ncbi:prolipoprotein diacylglyceryl transferase family protein [Geomesophilobacter sediminis]|uniref:Prolipoprotein diacylglyceryl transferase n=1 Tax=Geomesophilobacter sediminis TaxID=2798584 RepID=A0A8J7JCD9_9BACT|nr:prolipoprotein diacylglyceryl transferase family protein [Geomesophilobacter sediminis]MBJ6724448.1 prolipoprotein diacylglyceryl transferase [Geomesophilobacter sediminis]
MLQTAFLVTLGALSLGYLFWGWKTLPNEGWQIAAAVPLRKGSDGRWAGVNLTWYGILTANAYAIAVSLALVLMGAAGISLRAVTALVFLLLGCCVPASRLVAQLVEGKANTFTVGGAVFVGTILAPWIVELVNLIPLGDHGAPVPVLPALAAFAIAYAFGEGMGRLACVSFGCCYGKPLSACHPMVARVASPVALVFTGKTKKIAYASGLDGVKVLPVQGMTYLLYTITGVVATWFFLSGWYGAAYLTALGVTQGWRVISEFFRSDYRGGRKISVYQVMGLVGIGYGGWVAVHFGDQGVLPELGSGLSGLWDPTTFLLLQGIWIAIFLYTGLSRVTGSTMSFHVHAEKI